MPQSGTRRKPGKKATVVPHPLTPATLAIPEHMPPALDGELPPPRRPLLKEDQKREIFTCYYSDPAAVGSSSKSAAIFSL